jgi:hypothetical protein
MKRPLLYVLLFSALSFGQRSAAALVLKGITVTPHVQSVELRYRREPDRSLGARVQLFLQNESPAEVRLSADTPIRLRGKTPEELLAADEWAWHDFPSAWSTTPLVLPAGAITIWSFNGKRAPWGGGTSADAVIGSESIAVSIEQPDAWLSAVTFLGEPTSPFPTSLIFHIVNRTPSPLHIEACRLWLPAANDSWRSLLPRPWWTDLAAFPADGKILPGERGGARVATGRLPLTYAALEVRCATPGGPARVLWAHLRIKREVFDISGGWVAATLGDGNTLRFEPYLKTLRRMHINTGQHEYVSGYTDNPALYAKYPLKYFNRCQPFDRYDVDDVLPRIHAVEFLGEPQYGGGRPVPPMDVWRALAPYQPTRLPTSVTHSEERVWRFYAGLSDYPHYNAYRVTAPAADAWGLYERWDGEHLRWGAPLETVGDLTRSLRELNRPTPIACWSQGPHVGWSGYGGRARTSPTPDELRVQAYHALAARITSLYWFNLSLQSLLKFPDLIQPITEVGREIRMLEDFYLDGDAFHYQRLVRDNKLDWDLSVIAGPRGAVLFAIDLAYRPDREAKVFRFEPPREVTLTFPLPPDLRQVAELLRVDKGAITTAQFTGTANGVKITSLCGAVNVWVVSPQAGMAETLEARRRQLVAFEESFGFDPAGKPVDLERLRQCLRSPR